MKLLHSIFVICLFACSSVAFAVGSNDVDTDDANAAKMAQPKNQEYMGDQPQEREQGREYENIGEGEGFQQGAQEHDGSGEGRGHD